MALGGVGIEPLEAGRLVNAAAFGLTILAAGLYLRSNLRSQWLTLGATVAILASLPLSHLAAYFRTEALFVLLTLLALIQLAAFLHRKTDAALYWAAVFAALAALTRYPGVVLIAIGVLILLPLARRRHTLVFGAIFDEAKHHTRKQRYVQQLIEQAGELVIRADSTYPIQTWGVEQADEQVARAGWDVYRTGRKLTYHKQPCAPDDVHTIFVLQVSPDDLSYLSADRRPSGFDHLDFNFRIHGGIRLDDQCVVTTQLPDYPIGRLYIGRWIDGNHRMLWE